MIIITINNILLSDRFSEPIRWRTKVSVSWFVRVVTRVRNHQVRTALTTVEQIAIHVPARRLTASLYHRKRRR